MLILDIYTCSVFWMQKFKKQFVFCLRSGARVLLLQVMQPLMHWLNQVFGTITSQIAPGRYQITQAESMGDLNQTNVRQGTGQILLPFPQRQQTNSSPFSPKSLYYSLQFHLGKMSSGTEKNKCTCYEDITISVMLFSYLLSSFSSSLPSQSCNFHSSIIK